MFYRIIKYTIVFIIVLIFIYNRFYPDSYLERKIDPCSYWTKQIETNKNKSKRLGLLLFESSKALNRDHDKEIIKSALQFMSAGIPQDSATNMAVDIHTKTINLQIQLVEAYQNKLKETNIKIEQSKHELQNLQSQGKCK